MTDVLDRIAAEFRPPISRDPILAVAPPDDDPDIPLFELTPELCGAATVEERDHIVADLEKYGLLKLPFEQIAIRFPMKEISAVLNWKPLEFPKSKVFLTMAMSGALTIDTIYTTREEIPAAEREHGRTKEEMEAAVVSGSSFARRVVTPDLMNAVCYASRRGSNGKPMSRAFDLNEMEKEMPNFVRDYTAMAREALTILLASLAARNVVKDVRYNGRIGKGANSKPVYEDNSVTYISRTVVRPPPASEMENDPDHPPRGLSVPHLRRGHQHTVVHGKGRTGRRLQWFAPTYVNFDPAFIPKPHRYVVRP